MNWEAKCKHTVSFKKSNRTFKILTFAMFLFVSILTTAQQEVVINGRGFDPLINYTGVPDQVYEAWQGTILLDVDTSDSNGDYELNISSDEIINSTISDTEYKLSHNYPEPYSDHTKIDLTIPENTKIKIDIFNILGQKVGRQFSFSVYPGNFWMDIKGLYSNGIYFVRVTTPEYIMVEKTIRLDENANISPLELNKSAVKKLNNKPSITLAPKSSIPPLEKVQSSITIRVRSIGLIQYRDDAVETIFESQTLNFVRIRI